jgi:hypothetical protein
MAGNAGGAVRIYEMDRPDFTPRLRAKLEKRRDELIGFLFAAPAPDYAEYMRRVGIISGVREAIEFCLQSEKDDNRG